MRNSNRIHIVAFAVIAILVVIIALVLDGYRNDRQAHENGYRLQLQEKESGVWYYEIFYADELKVRQEFVPGVPGNVNFRSRSMAEKTGKLVMEKLQNGKLPVVTGNELENID